MTPEEQAIVARCAAAVCGMCDRPDKWQPVRLEDGDYYHVKVNRFDEAGTWCDANAIWYEFADDAAPVFSARDANVPQPAWVDPGTSEAARGKL